jgi:isopenicillin N synthase-like dioxygenase
MGEIDPSYILPEEYRPKHTVTEGEDIPLIDLSPITNRESSNPKAVQDLADKVGLACKTWGFFTVINHGVPSDIRKKIMEVSRKFFALPLEEKMKAGRGVYNTAGYHNNEHSKDFRDWREVYDFYVNDGMSMPASHDPDDHEIVHWFTPWPQNFPELRETCQEYGRECEKLFYNLMELVCLSLGLPPKRLHGYFEDQASFARLNRYPSCPNPDLVLGNGGHKDPSALTLLAQEDIEGLDVQRKWDGAWVRVKPIPDSFVINVGDVLQVWTNHIYESVEHRAVVNSEKERYSIPIFFYPSHDVVMKPVDELVNEQNPARYSEYNAGKWLNFRMYNNYEKRGFYMRVTDFKIEA